MRPLKLFEGKMGAGQEHILDIESFRVDPAQLRPDHLLAVPVADANRSEFRLRRVTQTYAPMSSDETFSVDCCSGTIRWQTEWDESGDSYEVIGEATRLPRPFLRTVLEYGLPELDPTFGGEGDRKKHAIDLEFLRTDPRRLSRGDLVASPTTETSESDYRVGIVDQGEVSTSEEAVHAVRFCDGHVADWPEEKATAGEAYAVRLMRPEVRSVLESSLNGDWTEASDLSGSYSVLEHGCPLCGHLHTPAEPCV